MKEGLLKQFRKPADPVDKVKKATLVGFAPRALMTLLTLLTLMSLMVFSHCGVKTGPDKSSSREDGLPLHPIREAYLLLDKNENPKAILLLEKFLAAHTETTNETKEAKFLLASAYFGRAGINIYTVYDGFKDLFFQDPLGANFWDDLKRGKKTDDFLSNTHSNNQGANTPIQKWLDTFDTILQTVRKLMAFLNRFPSVSTQNWPLIEKGLSLLNELAPLSTGTLSPSEIEDSKPIRTYRMFIRIVTIKSFILLELIADESFGSRNWACHLNLLSFDESLTWVIKQFKHISDDFRIVYPHKINSLDRLDPIFKKYLEDKESLVQNLPSGTFSFSEFIEHQLKEGFGCQH